jgi:type IX secretion system PorP/SprF family membrane protein
MLLLSGEKMSRINSKYIFQLIMRRLYFSIIFTLVYMTGFSQSNIRLNNFWENTYFINPASIYSDYNFMVSAAGRNQWMQFPGAPKTGYFTGAAFSEKWNTQIGIKAFRDIIGYTSLNNLSLSYTYSVVLDKNHKLNLGLSGNVQDVYYNMSNASTETIGDPAIYNNLSKESNFNADVGAELVGKAFLIGASSQNIASLFSTENKLQTNSNFLYVMYKMKSQIPIHINYGVCFIQNEKLSQFEFNVSSYFSLNNHPDLFLLGLLYRTKNEMAALFSIDIGKSVRFAYSYDFFIGDISRSSIGSQEIMLFWKFGKIPTCTTCTKLYK